MVKPILLGGILLLIGLILDVLTLIFLRSDMPQMFGVPLPSLIFGFIGILLTIGGIIILVVSLISWSIKKS